MTRVPVSFAFSFGLPQLIPPSELESLWNNYAARLRLLARVRSEFADDCVQEAFIKLSQQTKMPHDPMAWLVRVTRNFALTELRADRRRKNRETASANHRSQWLVEGVQSPGIHHPAEVESALQQLPVELKELVIAIIWNEMTFRQVAEAFDIPPATVHRRYMQALQKLRHNLVAATNTNAVPIGDGTNRPFTPDSAGPVD